MAVAHYRQITRVRLSARARARIIGRVNEPTLPLASFEGRVPPAPAWFARALDHAPEVIPLTVAGTPVELLAWGRVGAPGVLLGHGGMAHARWWSHIAPFLAQTHRIAALSWSGMGGSGWRETYSVDDYVEEAMAAAEAARLFATGPPVFVGHSFGGAPTVVAADRHGARLAGAILIDSGVSPPSPSAYARRAMPGGKHYPSLKAALARFRLMPDQPTENAFIVDAIARHALRHTPEGWTWRFDPDFVAKMTPWDSWSSVRAAACPLAFVYGEWSAIVPSALRERQRAHAAPGTPFVGIPESHHHVMIDQPLALIAAIRTLLQIWQREQL